MKLYQRIEQILLELRPVFSREATFEWFLLLTTDPETLPDNSTSFVMVAAPAIKLDEIGDSYGFRTWIEYGLKQAKDALGWADFRMTCQQFSF